MVDGCTHNVVALVKDCSENNLFWFVLKLVGNTLLHLPGVDGSLLKLNFLICEV